MYQRPSNKSSDRRHHPHPHPLLHAHRKLLDLGGLENLFLGSLIRYTLNRFIQLDFFLIRVLLKRYRQNTAQILMKNLEISGLKKIRL